jgi:hypothetical protein
MDHQTQVDGERRHLLRHVTSDWTDGLLRNVTVDGLAAWLNATMMSAGTRTRRQLLPPQAPFSEPFAAGDRTWYAAVSCY